MNLWEFYFRAKHIFCSYTDLMCFLNMGNNNIERMNGRDEGIREIGNWLRMDNK